jgi:hypothetical protein
LGNTEASTTLSPFTPRTLDERVDPGARLEVDAVPDSGVELQDALAIVDEPFHEPDSFAHRPEVGRGSRHEDSAHIAREVVEVDLWRNQRIRGLQRDPALKAGMGLAQKSADNA